MVHMHQNWPKMFDNVHPWATSHPVVMSTQRRPQPSPKEMNSCCCLNGAYERDFAGTSLCGFSKQMVEIVTKHNIQFRSACIFSDEEVR